MSIFVSLINLLFQLGVSVGVGASTVAIALRVLSLRDGKIDAFEKQHIDLIHRVMRFATVFVALGLVLSLLSGAVPRDIQYALQWAMLGALITNSLFMAQQSISHTFAPSLQAATWYALLALTILPVHTLPLIVIAVLYIGWIFATYLAVRFIITRFEHEHTHGR